MDVNHDLLDRDTNPESIYFVGNTNKGPKNQNQYGNTYNPNWRNCRNFSRDGNEGNQNQYHPQGQQQKYYQPTQSVPPSSKYTEDRLKKIMVDINNFLVKT